MFIENRENKCSFALYTNKNLRVIIKIYSKYFSNQYSNYLYPSMEVYIMENTEAWDYAIGMIKVDGLTPTEDFKRYIDMEKSGEVTMEELKQFLDKKYKKKEFSNA